MDDAKDAAPADGREIGEVADDTEERVSNRVEVVRAEGDVKRAEAERDASTAENDVKEELRDQPCSAKRG